MNVIKKIVCSKPVQSFASSKPVMKAMEIGAAASAAVSALTVSAFADDAAAGDISSIVAAAASVDSIMKNCKPFISPAIMIMCAFTGVRMGMKFLRGAAK